ncbi:MAG: hypothetical protein JSV20_09710, partial [Candidatus Bathyarchaeota archaeon]
IRHNRVHIEKADLGIKFSNITGDIIVEKQGRVKICAGSDWFFYTDLKNIPQKILQSVSETLKSEATNQSVMIIAEKINKVIGP